MGLYLSARVNPLNVTVVYSPLLALVYKYKQNRFTLVLGGDDLTWLDNQGIDYTNNAQITNFCLHP